MDMFILGTAQIGMKYGVTNNSEKPNKDQAYEMLNFCLEHNINFFDTAHAYGDSETLIGQYQKEICKDLNIVTKVNSFEQFLDSSIKLKNIYAVLIHSFKDYNNLLVDKLIQNTSRVGVSVYNLDEALTVLSNPSISIIQIPFNYLDRQWFDPKFIKIIRKNNITVHVRSIFLQGKLIHTNLLPNDISNNILTISNNLKLKPIELAISYIKTIDWIDGIIIGADNLEQIKENYLIFQNSRILDNSEIKQFQVFNSIDPSIIDPRKW